MSASITEQLVWPSPRKPHSTVRLLSGTAGQQHRVQGLLRLFHRTTPPEGFLGDRLPGNGVRRDRRRQRPGPGPRALPSPASSHCGTGIGTDIGIGISRGIVEGERPVEERAGERCGVQAVKLLQVRCPRVAHVSVVRWEGGQREVAAILRTRGTAVVPRASPRDRGREELRGRGITGNRRARALDGTWISPRCGRGSREPGRFVEIDWEDMVSMSIMSSEH